MAPGVQPGSQTSGMPLLSQSVRPPPVGSGAVSHVSGIPLPLQSPAPAIPPHVFPSPQSMSYWSSRPLLLHSFASDAT